MSYSGFSIARPPEIPRAGRRKRTIDPGFLTAYAETLGGLDEGTVVALEDTFEEKKAAHRAIVHLKHGLVDAGLVTDISTLRARVWEENGSFRAGLRLGSPRAKKDETPSAPAAAEPTPAPVAPEPVMESENVESAEPQPTF